MDTFENEKYPDLKYPAIQEVQPLNGSEVINNKTTIVDYWRYAHSSLLLNTERGKFAEFLVALAIGTEKEPLPCWNPYDLLLERKIKIEVKTSGYLQEWGQSKLSNILFSISEAFEWNNQQGSFGKKKIRPADIYVFCLHHHENQETVKVWDTSEWTFYIAETECINKIMGRKASISLKQVQRIAVESTFNDLENNIKRIAKSIMRLQ